MHSNLYKRARMQKKFKKLKTEPNSSRTGTKSRKPKKIGVDVAEFSMPYYQSGNTPNLNKIKSPLNHTRSDRYRPKTISAARYYITDLRNYYFKDSYSETAKIFRDHFENTFHAVKSYKDYEPISKSEIEKKKVNLGEKMSFSKKKILVLDMDETLIHAEYTLDTEHHMSFKMVTDTGNTNYVS